MPEAAPKILTGLTRQQISDALDRILRKGEYLSAGFDPYSLPAKPPEILSFNNPPKNTGMGRKPPYVDDPQGEFAMQYMRDQYPEAFKRIASVHVGAGPALDSSPYHSPGNVAGLTDRDKAGAPVVSIRETSGIPGGQHRVMDVIRHELAHVMGLGDRQLVKDPTTPLPTAYDVQRLSDELHQDIPLPRDERVYQALQQKLKK